jgi:hypothetical protein
VGSLFPKATGDVAAKNAQGQKILNQILNAEKQTVIPNRLGGNDIYDAVSGRGVRFDGNGAMKGFLEKL